MPRVSIIIPCYNSGSTIEETIDSIMSQTYRDFEVIIVNDGSTDEITKEVLNGINNPQIQLIHKENEGLAIARNTGIANSTGEFIIPLDADDKIDPTFIEKTLKLIETDAQIGVVYTDQIYFGEENFLYKLADFDFVEELVLNHISVCSLIRRSAYEKVKSTNKFGYNPNMSFGYEDWDFWISVFEVGYKILRLPEPLFFYRRSTSSMISRSFQKHDYLINQLIENHSESYAKYNKEIIVKLNSLYMDKVKYSKNLEKDTKNIIWLTKRLISVILNKK